MKEKSHKGQRHKGCGLYTPEKRLGNGADRRPARDRRQLERADRGLGTAAGAAAVLACAP